jgi:hypothetical protein
VFSPHKNLWEETKTNLESHVDAKGRFRRWIGRAPRIEGLYIPLASLSLQHLVYKSPHFSLLKINNHLKSTTFQYCLTKYQIPKGKIFFVGMTHIPPLMQFNVRHNSAFSYRDKKKNHQSMNHSIQDPPLNVLLQKFNAQHNVWVSLHPPSFLQKPRMKSTGNTPIK